MHRSDELTEIISKAIMDKKEIEEHIEQSAHDLFDHINDYVHKLTNQLMKLEAVKRREHKGLCSIVLIVAGISWSKAQMALDIPIGQTWDQYTKYAYVDTHIDDENNICEMIYQWSDMLESDQKAIVELIKYKIPITEDNYVLHLGGPLSKDGTSSSVYGSYQPKVYKPEYVELTKVSASK